MHPARAAGLGRVGPRSVGDAGARQDLARRQYGARNGVPGDLLVRVDGDDLVFTTHETSIKGNAIRRDANVALCVDDERPLFASRQAGSVIHRQGAGSPGPRNASCVRERRAKRARPGKTEEEPDRRDVRSPVRARRGELGRARALEEERPPLVPRHLLHGGSQSAFYLTTAGSGMAEGVGFEPTVSCPTHAFQACRFGRSRIPPPGSVPARGWASPRRRYPSRSMVCAVGGRW